VTLSLELSEECLAAGIPVVLFNRSEEIEHVYGMINGIQASPTPRSVPDNISMVI
jgi:hypothetical protein